MVGELLTSDIENHFQNEDPEIKYLRDVIVLKDREIDDLRVIIKYLKEENEYLERVSEKQLGLINHLTKKKAPEDCSAGA